MATPSNILLIYTGGTIGMVKDFETGALKAFNFDQLLERIPELKLLDCSIAAYSFDEPIDSSDMNTKHWLRSEEHTSELQSRPHLVCRLLLEKKKNKNCKNRTIKAT